MSSPFAIALLVLLQQPVPVPQTDRVPLTIEWIHGDGPREITTIPRTQWLKDGSLLMLDLRKPEAERTFERLIPATGARESIVDIPAALASLKELGVDPPQSLGWPTDLAEDGRTAVYLFGGDLYVLNLAKSHFRRLTQTAETEKCVQLSPDGAWVCYVRANDLYSNPTGEGSERQLTHDGSDTLLNGTLSWVYWEEIFGRRDIGYWWSPDSTAIAYLQTDESPVDITPFVDFDPAVPKIHNQRYPRAGRPNPKARVGVVDVAGKGEAATSWVEIDPASYEYIARVQWLPDAQSLSVQTMNRAQDNLRLQLFNRDGGGGRILLEEIDPSWINIHDDLRFLNNGSEFLWESERDGFAHLYRFAIDGTLLNRVTSGPWAVRSSGDGPFWLRQAVVGIDETRGWVYFTALEKSSIESHLYRVQLDGTGFERLTVEDGTHTVSVSPDGAFYVDRFSTLRMPPNLTLRAADGTLKATLAEPRTDLTAKLDLVYPEQITIPTRDGFAMPAELLKPRWFDPTKPHPLILYVYGGPSAPTVANKWRGSIYLDNLLAERGFVVAMVDHRAATAISHTLESRLARIMSGEVERNDVLDGVTWLKAQPWVDGERVGVWGWSGGGSFTLNLMTHSKEFRAGIAVAAVTDWRFYDTKWAEFAMRTPEQNPEGYDATSFVKSAKDLHGRLLLVHGTYDDNVHPQNAWAFINQLIEHNIAFDMMMYPMRQHGIADRAARIHLDSMMFAFWERWLKPD